MAFFKWRLTMLNQMFSISQVSIPQKYSRQIFFGKSYIQRSNSSLNKRKSSGTNTPFCSMWHFLTQCKLTDKTSCKSWVHMITWSRLERCYNQNLDCNSLIHLTFLKKISFSYDTQSPQSCPALKEQLWLQLKSKPDRFSSVHVC